ncbi:MAG: 2-oxoacid:ferredoxin oxidoreductase subunit beta [Cyclobacteriaceae bacterium]|nr:2-oxoacid:ferredoxin oxidoreductase subunit beta [Cyclobacteriaceae bacterium]
MKIKAPAGIKTRDQAKTKITMPGKDYASDQEIRWCPGCGDYSILKQVQAVLAEVNVPREETVFISGIGCSSRFPYYMNTYGMHSIHGRATAIASGLRAIRRDLNIWIITGDGDGLSIGGNHLIHLLRRNFNVNILLFNNEIYGLTKGQYSPTSPIGTINKTAMWGTIDSPFNPLALALGADASFVARGLDVDPQLLRNVLKRANDHKGASFVEIYQNCNVFNDGAFSIYTDKSFKKENTLTLEHSKPLIFGNLEDKGIKLDGLKPVIVSLSNGISQDELWIHDETDPTKASILSRFSHDPKFPRPLGVLYAIQRPAYEDLLHEQKEKAYNQGGKPDLFTLFKGKNSWEVH